jgi:hypothetical protein
VPGDLAERWQRLTGATRAVAALAESRALHHSIAGWQAALVQEALKEGSTWEDIGEALGTTRQAAWARFREQVESAGGMATMNQQVDVLDQVRNVMRDAQTKRREVDARWREEKERLRGRLRESQDQFREAQRRFAAERRAARDEMRRQVDALRSASPPRNPR